MGDRGAIPPAEFQILLALADGPKHGHGVKVDVFERTDGRIDMGPGTLYGAIKRLRRRGWITDVTEDVATGADDRMRFYAATGDGLTAVRAEAETLAALVGMARAKQVIG